MSKNIKNTYKNVKLLLDGNSYEGCHFDNCILEYSGTGAVGLEGCTFDNPKWVFSGPAQNTLQFLSSIYHGMGEGGRKLVDATCDNIKKKSQ